MDYEYISDWTIGQSKPNSNPIKPNFQKAKMNVNLYVIEDYRKKDDFIVRINKPNSNPILSAVGGFRKAKIACRKNLATPPAYTVRQLFDIVVLYKYHLPIINPFTPLLGQPNENHP